MYQLEISRTAHRQIIALPPSTQERINRVISLLSENPRHPGSKKLTGREGYRIRVGDYRILYQIDDASKMVMVFRVRARGDVYRI